MMKSVTAGLGVVTALAVSAAMTPSGLAVLGVRPSPRDAAITVIGDPPPPRPAVARTRSAPETHTAHAAPAARPADPRPVRVAAAHAPVAPSAPAGGGQPPLGVGFGQVANIASILMNLPQVLSQGQGGPSASAPDQEGGGGRPAWFPQRPRNGGDDHSTHAPGENHR